MARARNIKPGFYKNEDLAECSIWARYIFPGLWMLADREGRLEDRPKRIKGELLPFDGQQVEPLLSELADHGFIWRYRNTDGAFIQILKFLAHQRPHYSEKASVIKAPTFRESSGHDERVVPEKPPHKEAVKLSDEQGVIPPLFSESLIPSSPNPLFPNPSCPIPDKKQPLSDAACASPPQQSQRGNGKGNGKEKPEPPTRETWTAYSSAYQQRYGVEPIRNKTVNSKVKQFVERIGIDEAPSVAASYISSNRGLYVSAKHPVDLLLRDAETLRTEWATHRHGTETEGRMADRTATVGNVFNKLIEESREAKKNGH